MYCTRLGFQSVNAGNIELCKTGGMLGADLYY